MESSNMKNMVVLKNLPSNLVEEAIVILKTNKKVRKLEKVDKNNKYKNKESITKEKDYILKEAEMLVSNYINKLENSGKPKQNTIIQANKKYIRLKRYAYVSSIIILMQAILLMIK